MAQTEETKQGTPQVFLSVCLAQGMHARSAPLPGLMEGTPLLAGSERPAWLTSSLSSSPLSGTTGLLSSHRSLWTTGLLRYWVSGLCQHRSQRGTKVSHCTGSFPSCICRQFGPLPSPWHRAPGCSAELAEVVRQCERPHLEACKWSVPPWPWDLREPHM